MPKEVVLHRFAGTQNLLAVSMTIASLHFTITSELLVIVQHYYIIISEIKCQE